MHEGPRPIVNQIENSDVIVNLPPHGPPPFHGPHGPWRAESGVH